jgi:hypothetical protein
VNAPLAELKAPLVITGAVGLTVIVIGGGGVSVLLLESTRVVVMVMVPATVPVVTGILEAVPNKPWLLRAAIVKHACGNLQVVVFPAPLANASSYICEVPDADTNVSVIVPLMLNGYVPLSVIVAADCVAAALVEGRPLIVTEVITMVNDCINGGSTAVTAAGVAEIVKVELPAAVGVPLITPVDAFRFKPAGSVPAVTAQLEMVTPGTVNVC